MCLFQSKKAKKKRIIKRLDKDILRAIKNNDDERLEYLKMKMEMAEQLYTKKIELKIFDKLFFSSKNNRQKRIIKEIDNEILNALLKDDSEKLKSLKLKKEMAEKLYSDNIELNTSDYLFCLSKKSIKKKVLDQIEDEIFDDIVNNDSKNLSYLENKRELVQQMCKKQEGLIKKVWDRLSTRFAIELERYLYGPLS